MENLKNNSRDTQLLISVCLYVIGIFLIFFGCFYTRLKQTSDLTDFTLLMGVPMGLVIYSPLAIGRMVLAAINKKMNNTVLLISQLCLTLLMPLGFYCFSSIFLNTNTFLILYMVMELFFAVYYIYTIYVRIRESNK